jgi:hypothetical protein
MGWMIGIQGFDSWWGLGIFLFTTASKMALGLTQSPIQWVPGALFLGVKWLGCEADHSPPLPQYVFMVWCSGTTFHREMYNALFRLQTFRVSNFIFIFCCGSFQRLYPSLSPCVTYNQLFSFFFYGELLASPNPQAGGPPLVGCPWLLLC